MTKNIDNAEKVATANLSNIGTVDINYVGGSQFEFSCNDGRRFRVKKDVMDQLIAEKKVKLTAPQRYKEIGSSILPDGSTKTHNADGTLKSNQKRVLEKLEEEGYIEQSQNEKDKQENIQEEPSEPQKRISRKEKRIAAEQASNSQRNRADETGKDEEAGHNEKHENDNDQQGDEHERGEDLNGDGIIDEFDELVKQEQSTSPLVIATVIIFSILSLFLFFFSHAATTTLVHGQTFDLVPDSGITRDPNNQGSSTAEHESITNQNTNEQGRAEKRVVTRTDYDPASSIVDMPEAGTDQQKIAAFMLQTIRQDILNGDVNAFNQAVDLEKIANQLAPEYAASSAKKQNLNDSEKDELAKDWKQTFINNERQHVVSKDPNASIFCGRIRDIKTDKASNMRIYVITESISGDHQRVCLILDADGSGGWTLDGINDPAGYIKIVQEGPTSNNAQN